MIDFIQNFFASAHGEGLLRSVVIILIGWLLIRSISSAVRSTLTKKMSAQALFLLLRLVKYGITIIVFITIMRLMGFKLTAFLGAAGILTVAIGFASQTSASNLISGLFLIAERPFQIGDMIKVGELVGEVLSIDLLSIKLRTPDNLFVRVPNESIIKSNVTNLSRFPIRRFDLKMRLEFTEDLDKIKKCLLAVAANNPICLAEPQPIFIVSGFADHGVDFQFSVWAQRERLSDLRFSLVRDILHAFALENITIAKPLLKPEAPAVAKVDV